MHCTSQNCSVLILFTQEILPLASCYFLQIRSDPYLNHCMEVTSDTNWRGPGPHIRQLVLNGNAGNKPPAQLTIGSLYCSSLRLPLSFSIFPSLNPLIFLLRKGGFDISDWRNYGDKYSKSQTNHVSSLRRSMPAEKDEKSRV